MFGALGLPEIMIIAVIAALIFGPSRLPKLGKSIGETIREFKKIGKEVQGGLDEAEAQARDVKREFTDAERAIRR